MATQVQQPSFIQSTHGTNWSENKELTVEFLMIVAKNLSSRFGKSRMKSTDEFEQSKLRTSVLVDLSIITTETGTDR